MEEKPGPAQPMRTHTVLLLLFVASGCAALIYEIVWFHLLRLVIGASALSLGILLASFMGGMFLGSLLLARVVPITKHRFVSMRSSIGIGCSGSPSPSCCQGCAPFTSGCSVTAWRASLSGGSWRP